MFTSGVVICHFYLLLTTFLIYSRGESMGLCVHRPFLICLSNIL